MTAAAGGAEPSAFARNLAALSARLKRRRAPAPASRFDRRLTFMAAGAVAAAILVVVAVLLLDRHAVGWSRGLPTGVRQSFRELTRFGKSEWFLVPSGLFGLLLLFANWRNVARRIAAAWAEIGAFLFFFFLSVAGAGLTTDLFKFVIGRSRPERFAEDGAFTFTPFQFDSVHFSFPSGHATTAAAVATAVFLILRRPRLGALLLALFVLTIVVSRVAVRSHFPSDVVAGTFVGVAFTYGFAWRLGGSDVAFRRRTDGVLIPETEAIRGAVRRDGVAGLWRGLGAALSRAQPPAS